MESETQTPKPNVLARVGAGVFVATMVALGALELWRGAPLPGLHALPETIPEPVTARIVGGLLGAASFALLFDALRRVASALLAALWIGFAALAGMAAIAEPFDMSSWVPLAETLVFALAALTIGGWTPNAALCVGFGAMLLWFGATHLLKRELIASLIPEWIPYAAHWPWFTGGVMIATGLACVTGFGARWGALAVAAMYASWLPLVHAGRISGNDASMFEWTFALTAIALVGEALLVASSDRSTPS